MTKKQINRARLDFKEGQSLEKSGQIVKKIGGCYIVGLTIYRVGQWGRRKKLGTIFDLKRYPKFCTGGKSYVLHRYVWFLHHGPIPDGMVIRHLCNNPACINPKHLEVGTDYDNIQDRVRSDHSAKGEKHGRAKITEGTVRKILRSPKTPTELSKRYGISRRAVNFIRNGTNWKHVKEQFERELIAKQKPLPSKYAEIIKEDFWHLV